MKAKLIAAVLAAASVSSVTALAESDPGNLGDDNHDFIVAVSPDAFVCQDETGRHVLSSVPCDQWAQSRQAAAAKAQAEAHHGAAESSPNHQPHPPVSVTGPSANDSLY